MQQASAVGTWQRLWPEDGVVMTTVEAICTRPQRRGKGSERALERWTWGGVCDALLVLDG